MTYKLLYHPAVYKFFKKISKKDLKVIIYKIEKIANDPFNTKNLDVNKLINTASSYRLRYRKFRILYQINREGKTIYVREVDFRGNIY